MTMLKRYWPVAVNDMDGLRPVMDEDEDGDWVRYEDVQRQLAEIKAELMEQARLLSMSSEREAALLSQLAEANARIATNLALLNSVPFDHGKEDY